MGREIRRVPANWEHPKYTADNARDAWQIGKYKPLFDDHKKALEVFAADIQKMGLAEAIDYHGGGPQSDDYAQYGDQPLDWYQVYETVSEGTPVSPPFATQDELINYLCTHGDFWSQRRGYGPWPRINAERFVRDVQRVPTGICTPERGFQTGIEALGNPAT